MSMSDIAEAAIGHKSGIVGVNDSDSAVEDVRVVGNALRVTTDAIYGENSTDDRLYGGAAPASKIARTTTGAVKDSAGKLYGYIVTTALSAAAITLYDNASAASGTVVGVIPASTAAGTAQILAAPVPCTNGIYASFGGTGTVLFLYT